MSDRRGRSKKVLIVLLPHPPSIKKDGKLETMDEVLNNIFASVFNGNLSFHTSQVSGMQGDWRSKVLPTVSEERTGAWLLEESDWT